MPARIRIEKSDNISKQRMDWLGCHGNTWAPVKVMPGTCEACVFGSGEHSIACCWRRGYEGITRRDAARGAFLNAAYDLNQRGVL